MVRSTPGGEVPKSRVGSASGPAAPPKKKKARAVADEYVVFVRVVDDEETQNPVANLKWKLLDGKKKPVGEGKTDYTGTIRQSVKEAGSYTLELAPARKAGKPPAGGSHTVKASRLDAKNVDPEIVVVPPSTDPPLIEVGSVVYDVVPGPLIEVGAVVYDLAPQAPVIEVGAVVYDVGPQAPVIEVGSVVYDVATP